MTTTRNIGLNVQTKTTEEWTDTFGAVTALVHHLGATGQYVSVWSGATDDEVETGTVGENTTYDENTLVKVREALIKTLNAYEIPATPRLLHDLVNEMQNAGIFFRERAK